MPLPSTAKPKSTVADVPLYYERRSSTDRWGDLAKDESFSPSFLPLFFDLLDRALRHLWLILGTPKGIVSGGAYVDKPGAHGKARGFDLDGIIWWGREWKATDWKTLEQKQFYLGLQAHFLMYFGNVLGYLYNAAHHDHFHLDDLVPIGFRSNSLAIVTFVQESLIAVHNRPLILVDGDWGPVTARHFFNVLKVPVKMVPTEEEWTNYLMLTRSVALAPLGQEEKSELGSQAITPADARDQMGALSRIVQLERQVDALLTHLPAVKDRLHAAEHGTT